MDIKLTKSPNKPLILQGFSGFGLIGTIVTEYLIDHLQAEKIGSILVNESTPMVAIHKEEIVDPVGIYYSEKYNLIILHIIANLHNIEWQFADTVVNLAKQLDAQEILSIEGVVDPRVNKEPEVFYFSANHNSQERLHSTTLAPLKEGLVMGVSGALLLKNPSDQRFTSFFATTHSQLPDSKAAASVIDAIDKYLNLDIDPKPLLKRAKLFEEKFKTMMSQAKDTTEHKEKKNISYVG
jgi:uncharacterized protein